MIIFRYIAKEVLSVLFIVTTLLILTFLSTQFVRYLAQAAIGQLPQGLLFQLMLLQVPTLLNLLLPAGLYIALLFTLGRLYTDSEMVVMNACGISSGQILKMCMSIALVAMILVGISIFYINPHVLFQRELIINEAKSTSLVNTISPERFQKIPNSDRIFYVGKVSADHKEMQDVFTADPSQLNRESIESDDDSWSVMTAKRATIEYKDNAEYLVAKEGHAFRGNVNGNDYQVMTFDRMGLLVKDRSGNSGIRAKAKLSSYLFATMWKDPSSMAEVQWRFSIPLMTIILTLIALPLSRAQPRQGRYARILPALIIFFFYANLMYVSRDWLANGVVPAWVGMWWVHGLFLVIAALLWLNFSSVSFSFRERHNSNKENGEQL